MKTTEKKSTRIKLRDLKPKTLSDQDQKKLKGGTTPPPGGPVPIPYPNRSK
jgi:hypothetical protein